MLRTAAVIVLVCVAWAAAAPKPRFLLLMPSQSFLRLEGGAMVRVGSYLDETVVPAAALTQAGVDLVVATPQGNPPTMDPASNASSYFDGNETAYLDALRFWNNNAALNNPRPLSDFAAESASLPAGAVSVEELSQFDGVFVPGGHAPLIDLWPSTAVGRILNYFLSKGRRASDPRKPTLVCAICHGPIAFAATSLLPDTQPWPFAGRNMTVFTTAEEKIAQQRKWNGTAIGMYPEEVLRNLGGLMQVQPPWHANVVVDGNLITGQNPQSAALLAATILHALDLA